MLAARRKLKDIKNRLMIKIYSMTGCPDCEYVEEQVKGNANYEVINVGEHIRNLKAFLRLRDKEKAFDAIKRLGVVGVPCFVLEDGKVTFRPEEVGLKSRPVAEGAACNLDGTGC